MRRQLFGFNPPIRWVSDGPTRMIQKSGFAAAVLRVRFPTLFAVHFAVIACGEPPSPWQLLGNPITELRLPGDADWRGGGATLSIMCGSEEAATEYLVLRDWAEGILREDEFWVERENTPPGTRVAIAFEMPSTTVWYPMGYVRFVFEPQVVDIGEDGPVTFTSGELHLVEWRSNGSGQGAGAVLAAPNTPSMDEVQDLIDEVGATTPDLVLRVEMESLARRIWNPYSIDLRPSLRDGDATAMVATAATASGLRTARFDLDGFSELEGRCGQPLGSWLP